MIFFCAPTFGFPTEVILWGDEEFSKLVPKSQKQKPPRSVRTECAQLGVSVRQDSECGEAFAPSPARMPLPFGEIRKNPFPRKGGLTAAFFWYLFFAEAKKSTQELLSFAIFPLQQQRKVEKKQTIS